MIKRLNFTDRSRVTRDAIRITVHEGTPRTFDADLDLPGHLQHDAEIFIEVTSTGSPATMRFPCGSVAEPEPPRALPLTDITGERLLFSVKVVDQSEEVGRLVGLATGIRPVNAGEDDAGRVGLLPVSFADLGPQIWRLDFTTEEVTLLLNQRFGHLHRLIKNHAGVVALLYPEVVRHILQRLLVVERHVEVVEGDDTWPNLWLRFAVAMHPEHASPPDVPEIIDQGVQDEVDAWVQVVVDAFSAQHDISGKFASGFAADGEDF